MRNELAREESSSPPHELPNHHSSAIVCNSAQRQGSTPCPSYSPGHLASPSWSHSSKPNGRDPPVVDGAGTPCGRSTDTSPRAIRRRFEASAVWLDPDHDHGHAVTSGPDLKLHIHLADRDCAAGVARVWRAQPCLGPGADATVA